MKKNVLFMVINMNVGGTERALLNMIAEMPEDQYNITILMLENRGDFLSDIPVRVTVKYVAEYEQMKEILHQPPKKMLIKLVKMRQWSKAIYLLLSHMLFKITKNRSFLFKGLLKNVPHLKEDYDMAIAYAGPMDFISYFVIHRIKAKTKIQWIHFDVTKVGFHAPFAKKAYPLFEKVYVVSAEAREKLVKLVPTLEKKSEVFLNLVSPKLIQAQAKKGEGFRDHFKGIRILTVGRLSIEKGQDLAIKALKRLIDKGYDVTWYCLGEGPARSPYEALIKENQLEEKFILLGADPNPYCYIDQCDIYVQPSRYEGYCLTIIEARVLKKPIITTDVTGVKEQIIHNETGLIVRQDDQAISEAIEKLICETTLKDKFKQNLQQHFNDVPLTINEI